MKNILKYSLCALTLLAGLAAEQASADQFYLATGSNGIAGSLYLIDPATGAPLQTIGPLKDAGGHAYGLTGLAFQPGSGVLYGATTSFSPTAPGHLVTVDRTTALVTDIGSFGFPVIMGNTTSFGDITFDPTTGILYGSHSGGFGTPSDHWLYTINLATGLATKVGTGSRPDNGGQGLASNSVGLIFATPDGNSATPTLRIVDKTTGNETVVAPLTGGPLPHVIDAMDFDSSGVLFGIQTNQSVSPTTTHLVTIDTSTAVVTNVGPTVGDADALAILSPFLQTGVFQVRYAANLNLNVGDSVVDITNTGASSGGALTPNGNLCVNVYAFSPDEQLIECCTCLITPNGLASLSARGDLISNTLTPSTPSSIVIKLVSTAGPAANSTCNAATAGGIGNALTTGLAAWGTTLHALPASGAGLPALGVTETPFIKASLTAAELRRISTLCGFNQTNGSKFGVCGGCRPGGLGAATQR